MKTRYAEIPSCANRDGSNIHEPMHPSGMAHLAQP